MLNAPAAAVKPDEPAVSSQGTAKPALGSAKASTEDVLNKGKNRAIVEKKPEIKREDSKGSDKRTTVKPPMKNREHSDIFKSFSKSKAKLNREDTGSSAEASPVTSAPPLLMNVRYQFSQLVQMAYIA